MGVTNWKYPGTAASVDNGGGGIDWSNADNAKADDTSYASCAVTNKQESDWLRLTNFDFASELPSGAIPVGIEFAIAKYASASYSSGEDIYLRLKAGQIGSNMGSAAAWATDSPTEVTYGGATNMCGTTLTRAQAITTTFGFDFAGAVASSNTTLYVDYLKARLHYSEWFQFADGTASASSNLGSGYEADKAFDNSIATQWTSANGGINPAWVKYDMGAGNGKVFTDILLYAAHDGTYNYVKNFKIQGSNDDSDWTDLYTGLIENQPATNIQTCSFENSTAYRYFRLYFTDSWHSGYNAVEEIWYKAYVEPTTTTTPEPTTTTTPEPTTTTTPEPTTTTTTTGIPEPDAIPWDDSADTNVIGYASGLRLRKEDIPADFVQTQPLYEFTNEDGLGGADYDVVTPVNDPDIPSGLEVKYSRKQTRTKTPTTVYEYLSPGHLAWPTGPLCQPSTQDYWYKTPYHSGNNAYYVLKTFLGHFLTCQQWFDFGNSLICPVTGFFEDNHNEYVGEIGVYHAANDGSTWGMDLDTAWPDLTWHCITLVYNWSNQTLSFKLDGVTLGTGIHFLNIGSVWDADMGVLANTTRSHISYYSEFADRNITLNDPSSIRRPFSYKAITNHCRFWLQSGYAIQPINVGAYATENVDRVVFTAVDSVYEDTTFTMVQTKNLCTVGDSATADSGTPANAVDGDVTTYWTSAAANPWWMYQFASAKTIGQIEIYADPSYAPGTMYFYGSSNGTDFTAIELVVPPFTPTFQGYGTPTAGGGTKITINTPTAYTYYKIIFDRANIRIRSIWMREPGSLYTAENSTSITYESRVSTNGGSTWSSWTALASGDDIPDIAADTTYSTLRIELKSTLATENTQYQPIVESMTFTVYGVSSNETPHEILTINAPAPTPPTTTPEPEWTTTTTVPPETTTTSGPVSTVKYKADSIKIGYVNEDSVIKYARGL